ncbi:Tof1p [Sugiyamaella lignohabitans]|uniref:Topoisomerase 1-associated factor 1 n=1 Tax=Sugiyamaella lignohabitans TaxID=796027 RepID=A0A167CHG0_9ASCO|nr:Tof1p [Sugiyamaella lignohabitans]ANB11703.1 Tof1p [Sugiyamaella lignohabitans]
MRESFEKGEFQNEDVCYASILCYKQVLLTIKDMDRSASEEDREIADNMKTRLFYEEATLNMLASIPRTASNKNAAYIKDCIELMHIVLKMLESFSKQHTAHFVRSRRRQRKKKAAAEDDMDDIVDENEDEESKRVTHERKFEFARFEAKLINEPTVDTYKTFLQNYQELSDREIMWAVAYFHRTFVKREAHALFFSLDFMKLLQDMTSSSTSGLSHDTIARKEVEKFLSYYMAKFEEAVERTPSLYVELLFSKMPDTWYYFDHGYDKPKDSKVSRTAAVWVFKSSFGLDAERKVAIVVAALLDEEKSNLIEWLIGRIGEIKTKRSQDGNAAINEILAIDKDHTKWVTKEGKFRLLLELIGFTLEDSGKCIVPSSLSLEDLERSEKWLKRYLFTPVTLDDDMVAADYLRRKKPNESVEDHSDYSGPEENDNAEQEMNGFIAGDDEDADDEDLAARFADPRFNALPEDERLAKAITAEKDRARKKLFQKDGKEKKKKRRLDNGGRKAKKDHNSQLEKEHEKQRKIKSSAFVHDSDDESDEEREREFFQSEQKLRELISKANSGQAEEGDALQRFSQSQRSSIRTQTPQPSFQQVQSQSEDPSSDTNSMSESEPENSSESQTDPVSFAEEENDEDLSVKKRRKIVIDDEEE